MPKKLKGPKPKPLKLNAKPKKTRSKYLGYYNLTHEYYLNSQKYMECQLVTAINAAICLNEIPVEANSAEYDRLVDLVSARNGSAISIKDAYKYLRLEPFFVPFTWENVVKYLKKRVINVKNPIEFLVRSPRTGSHSILAIDCCDGKNLPSEWTMAENSDEEIKKRFKKGKMVKVLNFKPAPTGWIKWEKLLEYVKTNMFKNQLPKEFKVFRLNPWYIRQLQCSYNEKLG